MRVDAEEVAAVLDKAHDELLVRGWCQHDLLDDNGRVCALGALSLADGFAADDTNRKHTPAGVAAFIALSRFVDRDNFALGIIDFNNAPGRSIDDVLDAFRHAAKRVREQASA